MQYHSPLCQLKLIFFASLLSAPTFATTDSEDAVSSGLASIYFPANQLSVSLELMNLQGQDIANAGTIIPAGPGSEFPSLRASYDLNTIGAGFSYARNLDRGLPGWLDRKGISSNLTVGLSWSRLSNNDTSRMAMPAGSSEVGFLFTLLEPAPNDQTGANLVNADIQSLAILEVDYSISEVFLSWLSDRDLPGEAFWISRIAAGYWSRDIELNTRDTFQPTLPKLRNINFRKQKIDEDTKQVGIGGRLINPLGDSGRFDTFLDLMARVYTVESELNSSEYYSVNSRNRTLVVITLDRDETDFGLDIGAGAGWNLSDRWRAAAEAQVYLHVPTPSIINPVSGSASNPGSDPLPLTTIEYDNENLWGLRIALNYLF